MCLKYQLKFYDFVEIENKIWLANRSFNALVCLDKTSGKIHKIIKMPEDDIDSCNLYSFVFKIDHELILIPDKSDKILLYNLDTDRFWSINIREFVKASEYSNYKAAYQYKREIIMLPNRVDKILIYNHAQKAVSTIEIADRLLDRIYPDRTIQFRPQFEILDDHLYIPFAEAGAVLIINLESKQVEVKVISGLKGCDTINYRDGIFYLAAWNVKKIYALNRDLKILEEYMDFPEELTADEHIFAYSVFCDKKILFFPQRCNMIISFEPETKKIKEEMRITPQDMDYTNTYLIKSNNNKIISLMIDDLWLSELFYSNENLMKKAHGNWDDMHNNKMIERYLLENGFFSMVRENDVFNLNNLFGILSHKVNNSLCIKQTEQKNITGRKIYQYMVKNTRNENS